MYFNKSIFKNLAALIFISSILVSCQKDDNGPKIIPVAKNGVFVLNEGGFNQNNSSLTLFDFDSLKTSQNVFSTINQRGLGDTGNDMKIYKDNMYVVVNGSSTLEILNAKDGKSIKKIDFKNGEGVGRQPRNIIFNNNKGYISSFDGTVAVLNLSSLTIEKYITVGRNPEGMAIANGKLYVANSGGLDYPNYDTSVSVVDLTSETELKKITVTINPKDVAADAYGDIYVKSIGNYDDVAPALTIINSSTDVVKQTITNFSGSNMTIAGDLAYFTTATDVKTFNVKTETIDKESFITDDTKIGLAYGVTADLANQQIFITDGIDYLGVNGKVFCFDLMGKKKYVINAGILPAKVVVFKN